MDVNQGTHRSFVTNISKSFVSEIMAGISLKTDIKSI